MAPDDDRPAIDEQRVHALGLLRHEVGGEPLAEKLDRVGRQNIDDMRSALAAGDATVLRAAAHTLRGSSAQLGAVRLSALARELEAAARDRQLDGVRELLDRAAFEHARAVAAVRELEAQQED